MPGPHAPKGHGPPGRRRCRNGKSGSESSEGLWPSGPARLEPGIVVFLPAVRMHLSLALNSKENKQGGFWTPATLLGDLLLDALQAQAGLSFQLMEE